MADQVFISPFKRPSGVSSQEVDIDAKPSCPKKTHLAIDDFTAISNQDNIRDKITLNYQERTALMPLLCEAVPLLLPDICKIVIAYRRACVAELVKSHIVSPQRLISLSDGLWCWGGEPWERLCLRFDEDMRLFVPEPPYSPLGDTIGHKKSLSDSTTGCAVFGGAGSKTMFVTASTSATFVNNFASYTMQEPYPNSTNIILLSADGYPVVFGNVNGAMSRVDKPDIDANTMFANRCFERDWFCRISAENAVGIRRNDRAVCLINVSGVIRLLTPSDLSSSIMHRDQIEYAARYQDMVVWLTTTELCIMSVHESLARYSINRYPLATECHGKRVRFPIVYGDCLFAFRETSQGVRLLEISLIGAALPAIVSSPACGDDYFFLRLGIKRF